MTTAGRRARSCGAAADCVECGTKALKTAAKLLSAMPARSTDGARVVEEPAGLEGELLLEPLPGAQPALVQRDKGKERQYRLACRSCAAVVGYRSVPLPAAGKFLYIDPAAVRETPPTPEEIHRAAMQRRRREEAAAKAAEAEAVPLS